MVRLKALALCALLAVPVAEVAHAYVPPTEKINKEVARANRKANRVRGLRLEVALYVGSSSSQVAAGELISDPRSVARMELRSGTTVERHLLRGGQYTWSRNGVIATPQRRLLPPLFFLQAGTADVLSAALLSIGGSPEETVLGRIDGSPCYVLGGRDLLPPANDSAALVGSSGAKSAIWAKTASFDVLRIQHAEGVRFSFGPLQKFEAMTLPSWVVVEEPGQPPARLEVLGASSSSHEIGATFGPDWLTGP